MKFFAKNQFVYQNCNFSRTLISKMLSIFHWDPTQADDTEFKGRGMKFFAKNRHVYQNVGFRERTY